MAWWKPSFFVALLGCAHAPPPVETSGPTLELRLDEGRPDQKPLTPDRSFEMLMRFDPKLPQYVVRRIRFLLAQPGHLVLTVYETSPEGNPGAAVDRIDRVYEPIFVSDGKDGRWVVETPALGERHAPLWIGLYSPGGGGDPRLWATSNTSDVFQRDADPTVPLYSGRIPRTPVLRVEVAPVAPSP
jgi:hypothetical protein